MADYFDLQLIAGDGAFQGRCQYALKVQALFEMNNTQDIVPEVVALCNQVIAGQISGYQIALIVLTAGAVAAAATVQSLPGCTAVSDELILSAIASNFNAMAGIPAHPAD